MKFSGNQKNLYLLAALLIVLTILLCLVWNLCLRPRSMGNSTPHETANPGQTPLATDHVEFTASELTSPIPEKTQTMKAVVYYQDNNGYLVPVMREIAAQEGVAKAALATMVQGTYNDMEAARLGLRCVLPENMSIELDIAKDGVAQIDLGKEALTMADAGAESNMVNAIVQTLTEFPTVDKVRFLVGGQKIDSLKHGTSVSGDFVRGMLNLESASVSLKPDELRTVTLYFQGDANSMIVPVTRMVYGPCDVETAVLELTKGPGVSSPLTGVLPAGCGVRSITKGSDGIVTIDFTNEFIALAEESDGGRLALKALVLTCTQFDGVTGVKISVEGQPYDPGEGTMNVPAFVNSVADITDSFLQTQAEAIFEAE